MITCRGYCSEDYYDPVCRYNATVSYQNPPLLFNLHTDPGERIPLDANEYSLVIEKIGLVINSRNTVAQIFLWCALIGVFFSLGIAWLNEMFDTSSLTSFPRLSLSFPSYTPSPSLPPSNLLLPDQTKPHVQPGMGYTSNFDWSEQDGAAVWQARLSTFPLLLPGGLLE